MSLAVPILLNLRLFEACLTVSSCQEDTANVLFEVVDDDDEEEGVINNVIT